MEKRVFKKMVKGVKFTQGRDVILTYVLGDH